MPARSGLAEVAEYIKQADGYYRTGQYLQTEQTYRKAIAEADPNKPEEQEIAFAARRKLPSVYLATDRVPQAQAAVLELLVKHPQHERLPHALHEIVEQAKALNRTLLAGQIYQALLAADPNQPKAIWLKMGMAIASVHLGDVQAVDTVLQNIVAKHVADERAAESLGQIAWAYRKLEQYDKARTVYQYVVDNWAGKDRAIFSQRGIILCSLELKDQQTADKSTEDLFSKFAGDKNIAQVTWTIAHVYLDRRDWQRTRPLCQYILTNHLKADDALWAQQALIFASIAEKDRAGVETGVQSLFARFSSNKNMPSAVYRIARQLNGVNDAKAQ